MQHKLSLSPDTMDDEVPVGWVLDALHHDLETTLADVEKFQGLVAELLGRAGAAADADMIRRSQAIDPISQDLAKSIAAVATLRRSLGARDLADAAVPFDPAARALLRRTADGRAAADDGDCDFF